MKTLKNLEVKREIKNKFDYSFCWSKDIREKLEDFYSEYWRIGREMDKGKRHITCDKLDFLMDKHFNMFPISTLQELPNQDKNEQ